MSAPGAHEQLDYLRLAVEIADVEVPEVVLPDDKNAVVGNMRLHYLDWGNAYERPILFLHGGGLNAHTWDLVCLALRNEYHCVALDQRGHGDSEWSPEIDYSAEAHAGDLEGFIEQAAFDRPVIVGQSMGALNGMLYTSAHADQTAALVVIDAGPEVRLSGAQRIRDFVAASAVVPSLDEAVDLAVAFNPLRDRRLLRRSLRYNLRPLPDGTWARKNDVRGLATVSAADIVERAKRHWEDAPRITCPTLIVRGAESDVFSDDDARMLAGRLPRGTWARVEGAGHTVQGDNPAGLLGVLRPFLAAVTS